MSTSDSAELHNLITDLNLDEYLTNYKDKKWEFVLDSNNGSYSNTPIIHNLQNLRLKHVNYARAYYEFPAITITPNTGSYTANSFIAVRDSICSLFYSVLIQDTAGKTLVNEVGVQWINSIRNLVESHLDFVNSEGALYQFDKNTGTINSNDANPYGPLVPLQGISAAGVTLNAGALDATAGTAFTTLMSAPNAAFNKGFANRIVALQNASVVSGNNLVMSVFAPTLLIHDFWKQQDFPQIGAAYMTQLGTTFANSANIWQNQCLMVGSNGSTATPALATNNPIMITAPVKFWYESIFLNEPALKRVNEVLSRRAVKKVPFLQTTVFPYTAMTGTSFSQLITSGIVGAKRIWILSGANGQFTTANNTALGTVPITGLNCYINGTRYYELDQTSTYQQWKEVQNQFPDGQSLISYNDWINGNYKIYLLDIQRLPERVNDPMNAVSILIQFQKPNASHDFLILVEQKSVLSIAFGGETSVLSVGPY